MKRKFKIFCCSIIISIFTVACANIQSPSGGPPDTTPPEIFLSEPEDLTLNFDDDRIRLKFTKYMNRNSVIENFYILPTTKVSYKWSGKDLIVDFDEPLSENTTYSINIGSDYSDFRNNKAAESFSLIFSTGSIIDSGRIAGSIITANPQGIFIFGYNITSIDPDTLNPLSLKPHYKVQIGSTGNFVINGLPDGKYRLFAVLDKFKDGSIDDVQDMFAAATSDIIVENGRSDEVLFRFGKNVDISPPKLFSAQSLTNRKISAYFSKMIDSSSIDNSRFLLGDSISGKSISVIAAYRDKEISNVVNLISSEQLELNRRYSLSVMQNACRDTSGNFFADSISTVYFTSSSEIDSTHFAFVRSSIADSSIGVRAVQNPIFHFNEPIENIFSELISFFNATDSINVEFSTEIFNETAIKIIPNKQLKYNTNYKIAIKPDAVQPKFGIDSRKKEINLIFTSEDNRTSGIVSGSIIDSSGNSHPKIFILYPATTGGSYMILPDSSGNWTLENIRPGIYKMWAFEDSNHNQKYDYGNLFPFEFAEKFYMLDYEINVRSRWHIEGVQILIGGSNEN